MEQVIGVSCDGLATYDHYGITYVMPAEVIAATGKSVTVSADGLSVEVTRVETTRPDVVRVWKTPEETEE